MEPVPLEDWLQKSRSLVASALSGPSSQTSTAPASTPTAEPPHPDLSPDLSPDFTSSIVYAWSRIRALVQPKKDLTKSDLVYIELLNRHLRSLHLADSQVKLLQALLASTSSDPAVVEFARRFAITGLLRWIRTYSQQPPSSSPTIRRLTQEIVESVAQSVRKSVEEVPLSNSYACEAILLLGAISNSRFVSADVKQDCCVAIAGVVAERKEVVAGEKVAVALAGAGYGLASASPEHARSLLRAILFIWTPPQDAGLGGTGLEESDFTVLKDVVMVLHLMDYLSSLFLTRGSSTGVSSAPELELLHSVMRGVLLEPPRNDRWLVCCSSIMACVGLVRSLYRWVQIHTKRGIPTPDAGRLHVLLQNLESLVGKLGEEASTLDAVTSSPPLSSGNAVDAPPMSARKRELLRCLSVAVSRCKDLSPSPGVRRCLVQSIFRDALSLETLYPPFEGHSGRIQVTTSQKGSKQPEEMPSDSQHPPSIGYQVTNLQQDPKQPLESLPNLQHADLSSRMSHLQFHVSGLFFQELGAVVRVLCEQCRWAHPDEQKEIELLAVDFSRALYTKHRVLLAMAQAFKWDGWAAYRQTLEDALEAAFLTVAIFFSSRVKGRAKPASPAKARDRSDDEKRAVLVLEALSCVEFFRHVHLREFSQVVQLSVSHITGSEAASLSVARSLPTYQDLTHGAGIFQVNPEYGWLEDEVQTARMLFYFRVMPLCLVRLPEQVFGNEVASTMFLYMHHPSEAVSRAAHALFAAFLSLGAKSEALVKPDEEKVAQFVPSEQQIESAFILKESLAVYYIQRALQKYPEVTPFEGLVAGLGAIARQLPEGSPAVVFCLNFLADKASLLYKTSTSRTETKTGASERQGPLPKKDMTRKRRDRVRNADSTEDSVVAAQRLYLLLLHLVLLVDLQVLPASLKLVAKLILNLPQHLQVKTLAEAFDVVGTSDDYTRKPTIVPWLQSLAFLVLNKPKDNQQNTGSDDPSLNSPGKASDGNHPAPIDVASSSEGAARASPSGQHQLAKEDMDAGRSMLAQTPVKVADGGQIGDERVVLQVNEGSERERVEVRSRL